MGSHFRRHFYPKVRSSELISRRKAQIHHVPSIMATAARLDDQVLHSDYSILNILFDEAGLRAVIDFRPRIRS
jgi:aminoglycoside phosphotransferase (APT) family kinase protein